jgi:ectoine hydroxylase-related dioxygenase (phytanoyl-CoA dioxygenase family)
MPLLASDVRSFRSNGVVCLRNFFPRSFLRLFEYAIKQRTSHVRVDLVGDPADGAPLEAAMFLWREDESFRSLIWDFGMPELAARLMDASQVRLFSDTLLIKPPGCPVPLPWHRDLPYHPITGSQFLSVWVSLDPVADATGGVKYVAGSHKAATSDRVLPFPEDHTAPSAAVDHIPGFEECTGDLLSWHLAPGDCLVHHGLTVHASPRNSSPQSPRRALIVRFAGDDVRWCPRANAIAMPDPKLSPGQELSSELFPVVWSRDSPLVVAGPVA